jgi:undecaprenyl-diphosphatase
VINIVRAIILGLVQGLGEFLPFLLSAPIILGAALVKVPELAANPSMMDVGFLTGMGVACASGLAAIGFLLRYVQTGTFLPFVVYRLIAGAVVIGLAWFRCAS